LIIFKKESEKRGKRPHLDGGEKEPLFVESCTYKG
jgi:hypothetical protein